MCVVRTRGPEPSLTMGLSPELRRVIQLMMTQDPGQSQLKILKTRVADPYDFNDFNADPVRIRLCTLMRFRIQILLLIDLIRIWDHLAVYRPSTQGSILSLHASTVSVHCPPRLPKLLNFDFNADPDQVSHYNEDNTTLSPNLLLVEPLMFSDKKLSKDGTRFFPRWKNSCWSPGPHQPTVSLFVTVFFFTMIKSD